MGQSESYFLRLIAEESINAFNQALVIEASCFQALMGLGYAYKKCGHIDLAIIFFRRALQVDSCFLEAWSGLAHCLLENGEISEALLAFDKCLEIHPWDPSFCEIPARWCDAYHEKYHDNDLKVIAVELYKKAVRYGIQLQVFFCGTSTDQKCVGLEQINQLIPKMRVSPLISIFRQ